MRKEEQVFMVYNVHIPSNSTTVNYIIHLSPNNHASI